VNVPSRLPIGVEPWRLRVADLGRLLAGPVVATLLGDLGAEAIKVEHPAGGDTQRHTDPQVPDDPAMSYAWQVEARNKRSVIGLPSRSLLRPPEIDEHGEALRRDGWPGISG
jgi:hypothetical protein